MSESRVEKVTCPVCRHAQDFTLAKFLDVTDNPGLKQALLSGELTRMTCAKCGAETDVLFPLLYHDTEFRLMIWLIPVQGTPGDHDHAIGEIDATLAATHQFRVVRTANELKEKVVIAEAGLDDRVVEFFKVVLRREPGAQIMAGDIILFGGLEREADENVLLFTVLRGTERFEFSIPFETFAHFSKEAEPLAESLYADGGLWLTVDEATTTARLRERNLE
jgi:hypothetical protein